MTIYTRMGAAFQQGLPLGAYVEVAKVTTSDDEATSISRHCLPRTSPRWAEA